MTGPDIVADRRPTRRPVAGRIQVVTAEPVLIRRRTDLSERLDDLRGRHPWVAPALAFVLLAVGVAVGRSLGSRPQP